MMNGEGYGRRVSLPVSGVLMPGKVGITAEDLNQDSGYPGRGSNQTFYSLSQLARSVWVSVALAWPVIALQI
jgi:hypothetical protein